MLTTVFIGYILALMFSGKYLGYDIPRLQAHIEKEETLVREI